MAITITVNGTKHEVEEGQWLIDALNDLGFDIPHFCYHPGLGPDGNCRMCQVAFVSERGSRLAISCNQKVFDGLEVLTDSEEVKAARAGVEEMLLLNHPLDCPICDKAGECTLQDYYMDHDMKDTRQEFVRFKKRKAQDIGPTMVLDQQRCVLCDRCVRFLRDWAGSEELYIAGRGHDAFLTTFPGKEVTSPYSLNTVDLCPVGALTSKDFRFATPTWFLKRTPSTCTTCSRGCAIEVDTANGKVHRLRPRHNPHVNGWWMCDEGRLNYKFVNSDRIKRCSVARNGEMFEASMEDGINELRAVVGIGSRGNGADTGVQNGVGGVVILASATCTLEEMFALKQIAASIDGARYFVARHVPDGEEDELLRKSDRHANLKSAELLGVPVMDLREDVSEEVADDTVLVAVGFDCGIGDAVTAFFDRFSKVAVVASRESELTKKAQVVIPGLLFAEKEGLIINFESHIQHLSPAFDDLWDRVSPWQVLAEIVEALTGESRFNTIADLRKAVGAEPAFSGVDLNAIGPTGVRLEPQTV